MSSFTGQVALITGAANGIGRQLAFQLAREGALIAAIDRDQLGLEKLARELTGVPVAVRTADVTEMTEIRKAVADLENELGPVELLIASAGIGIEMPAVSFRAEDFATQVHVNLIGVANSIDAVLPSILSRRRGHIAAISSLASFRGFPHMAGYSASKAGVNALLDSLRVELRPLGVSVTTICPGWVRTGLTADVPVSQSEMMTVEAAAARIMHALRRKSAVAAFPVSQAWPARVLRLLPTSWSDMLTRRLARRHVR
jgi:short-subunit dehydrogenase